MSLLAVIALGAVAWDRPWGLGALVLPALVLALSLRRERPRAVPIGTLALWRDTPAGSGGARRRHRLPPARLALILALVAGALALAGPHRPDPEARPLWHVVVDGGASLLLPHTDATGTPTGRGSRLDVGLAALEDARRAAGVELEFWLDRGRGPEPLDDPADPAGRRAALARGTQVDPRAHDRPGVLFLTDRAPAEAPRRGGVLATGGGPVPGPIARSRGTRVVWDGAALREEPATSPLTLAVEGTPPRVLADLLELWAADRGFVDGADGVPVDLRVVFEARGTSAPARFARDGWKAAGAATRAPLRAADDPLLAWLRADLGGGPVPVVTHGDGVVHVAVTALEEPAGEPGAFAVSWSELLDGAVRAAEDVLPLEGRVAAGPLVLDPPEPGIGVVRAGPDWPWSARLALGAAVLVAVAVALGEGRPAARAPTLPLGRR